MPSPQDTRERLTGEGARGRLVGRAFGAALAAALAVIGAAPTSAWRSTA